MCGVGVCGWVVCVEVGVVCRYCACACVALALTLPIPSPVLRTCAYWECTLFISVPVHHATVVVWSRLSVRGDSSFRSLDAEGPLRSVALSAGVFFNVNLCKSTFCVLFVVVPCVQSEYDE